MLKSRELTDQDLLAKLDKGDALIDAASEEVAYLDGYNDAKYGYAHNPQGFSIKSGLSEHTDAYNEAYTRGYNRAAG